MVALFALLGAGLGAAILLATTGLRATAAATAWTVRRPRLTAGLFRRAATAGAAGAVVGAITGWPVAAVLAAIAVHTLPPVLGPDHAAASQVARIEAIAAWAEDLAATLRSAAGLEQAISHTVQVASPAIRGPLTTLAVAHRTGTRLPEALRTFANDLADPTADLVVHVLLQAAQHQAADLSTSLAGVGRTARRHAATRLRIATGRARTRAATRIVIIVVLATTLGMFLFADAFLSPYGTGTGQVVLAAFGGLFGASLMWMVRIGRIPDLPRILTNPIEGPR
ncbi:type II secretion system F family protein [Phytohabitans kaempferiae]|uniref:Type II secretion system F family protein n=1 Tax=Phytohabitans kaempferiae TaxID=1620943 RepID=A0ABV6M9F3_9ACTN